MYIDHVLGLYELHNIQKDYIYIEKVCLWGIAALLFSILVLWSGSCDSSNVVFISCFIRKQRQVSKIELLTSLTHCVLKGKESKAKEKEK